MQVNNLPQREGQPCSTDDFVRRLVRSWCEGGLEDDLTHRLIDWAYGNWDRAMKGMK